MRKVYETTSFADADTLSSPRYVIDGGRMYRAGWLGGKAEDRPEYVIQGDKVYDCDAGGNKRGSRPVYVIKDDKLYRPVSFDTVPAFDLPVLAISD